MKAVLFDLDGTLIDSSEGIFNSAIYALEKMGVKDIDREKLRVFIGPPLRVTFKEIYGFSEEDASKATDIYRERYNPIGAFECTPYEGVEECIKELKNKGYLIGMASSKPEATCQAILKHLNIYDLFDDVVGATFDGRIATKEQVLNEVMRRWSNLSKDDMVLIGDTNFDVDGANLVGIKCIGVSFGFGNVDDMLNAGAVCVVDHMNELPDEIDRVLK